ncbi:MAG TPA: DedA family protein [Dermatophilaceae bacterium]|nr:DedA family protein [Dermatophilaceae bacterium]
MEDLVDGWPVWLAFGVLFLGAFARGNATYWVGRGLRSGGERSRMARHLDRPLVARAEGWVRRFGAPAVSLGFLTVGVQSAINAAAGMLRMPLRRFLPAVTVGAALWAALYTTVGLAVVDAVLGRTSWSWVLAGLAVVGVTVVVSRRLAAGRPPSEPSRPHGEPRHTMAAPDKAQEKDPS